MTTLHNQYPRQGHLLHRVLGQPVQRSVPDVLRHAQVRRPHARDRDAAQLGEVGGELEPRARPVRRPARRWLRHLHRSGHRRDDGTVTRNAEYYALGHLSRFVRPGAVRIASTSFGTPAWNGQITDVAFRNPNGSTVLVAHNENDNPQSFSVSENGQSSTTRCPAARSRRSSGRSRRRHAPHERGLDPTGWSATADPSGPTDPCCTDDVASHAVDDDATTRWSTGTAQTAGQYLQVDLGRTKRVTRFVLDTGASTGDYPRRYTVSTSTDGTHWTTVRRPGWDGQLTASDLNGSPVRFVRTTLTSGDASWWSVADARAYVRTH